MIFSRVATKLTKGLAKRAYTSTAASYDLKVADKPKAANIHHFKIYRWDPDQDQDVRCLFLVVVVVEIEKKLTKKDISASPFYSFPFFSLTFPRTPLT